MLLLLLRSYERLNCFSIWWFLFVFTFIFSFLAHSLCYCNSFDCCYIPRARVLSFLFIGFCFTYSFRNSFCEFSSGSPVISIVFMFGTPECFVLVCHKYLAIFFKQRNKHVSAYLFCHGCDSLLRFCLIQLAQSCLCCSCCLPFV